MKDYLTHSRSETFKICRKRHLFAYEFGIRRVDDAKALRQGTAFHLGTESLGDGLGLDVTCQRVRDAYFVKPDYIEQTDWEVEQETILRLVCGYDWRWQDDRLEYVATEFSFSLPLINPATGAGSKTFNLAGKIDGIVKFEDGRLAVKETKTSSEELDSDSPLWKRLRMDHQISLYVLAARRMGYDVSCVLYDVCRKPSIKPTTVPILDELGAKIVLDRQGDRVKTEKGSWRQTGSTEHGYTLQSRPMTAGEWGTKLTTDIGERPDFYYARREVPRLNSDLDEYEQELWSIAKQVIDARKNNRHYRTVNKNTCEFCSYFDMCVDGWKDGDSLPEGFVKLNDPHPELTTLSPSLGNPINRSLAYVKPACNDTVSYF